MKNYWLDKATLKKELVNKLDAWFKVNPEERVFKMDPHKIFLEAAGDTSIINVDFTTAMGLEKYMIEKIKQFLKVAKRKAVC